MKFFQDTLARRIVALMIFASATLSLLAAAVQLYFSYNSDLERVMDEIDVVETSFLSGLENALWEFNFEQANVLVDGIYAQADIVDVTLTVVSGQSFVRGSLDTSNAVLRTFPVIHKGADGQENPVGEVTVALSLDSIRARLWSQFLTLILSNFVKTLAASVIMLFIFERMVSRHLRHITEYVSHVEWDTQEADIALQDKPKAHADDLLNIVGALNESRHRLQSSQKRADTLGLRMEAVLGAATSGIISFDAGGRLTTINPHAKHMLGILARDLPCTWPSSIHFLDAENMSVQGNSADPIERALAGHTLKNETAIMSRSAEDRDPRYVRMSSANLPTDSDADVKTVLVIDDVSEHEKNRQQVERSSRLDALGQLTGGVAHDFNNLLTSVSYGVELAQRTDDKAKRAEFLGSVMASVDRGAALTKRLLAFAKRQPGIAQSRSVALVFTEFYTLARPILEETIDLDIHVPDDDLYVYCDTAQLENALLNLVINARDAMLRSGKGNKISLDVRSLSEVDANETLQPSDTNTHVVGQLSSEPKNDQTLRHIEISVSDNGPGMDEEVRRRAIDPFFTTKNTNSGTGLGLSMVYGFVQQSDGLLQIYSEKEIGTTVRMVLPRGLAQGGREALTDREPHPEGIGQTILIVEDDTRLAKVMGEMVGSFGYRVLGAGNGRAAIEVLKSDEIVHCLLTDVVMPDGIGGFELAAMARQIRPEIPIIYMSGYTGFSKAQMGQVTAPILAKPAPPDELALALQLALSPGAKVDS